MLQCFFEFFYFTVFGIDHLCHVIVVCVLTHQPPKILRIAATSSKGQIMLMPVTPPKPIVMLAKVECSCTLHSMLLLDTS